MASSDPHPAPDPLGVPGEVTRLMTAIESGDPSASEQLLPLVYRELRGLAAARLAREQPGQTLQATALVHEAWLRLVGGEPRHWNSRGHFFGAAAEAMRRLLIENARRKRSLKRGGDLERVNWSQVRLAVETDDDRLIALHEALERLEADDPQAAQLVKLRFFAGLTGPQTAQALGLAERTAARLWAYARAWLLRELQADAPTQWPRD
ncbi:MAG: sigma-70 family RNA polymerase sigma factor [Verrucomicrobiae bacterium]|nr:sigma-70 family RNA polymerase sigma factor [Verrucomicrobiae bacterium]